MTTSTMITEITPPWWVCLLIGRNPKRTLLRMVMLVFVSFLVFKFLFIPIRVTGNSMAPTYNDGKFNLVNRLYYKTHKPQRGDVVAIQMTGTRVMLLKRIVGLPGEKVELFKGRVFIDGQPLGEPYLSPGNTLLANDNIEVVLGPDEYFYIGDNRRLSTFDRVPSRRIAGKVLF